MTVREVCRLRLIKAMIDAGVPVGAGIEILAEDFLDPMQSMLQTVDHRDRFEAMFAVIAWEQEGLARAVVFDLRDALGVHPASGPLGFQTATILNLAALAAEMGAAMRDLSAEPRKED